MVGFLERHVFVPADREGIAISTFGKIIKRGWEWLGLAPAIHSRITGLIEAPDLAASLALSKNDFIRSGARGATYLAYRKAIQEVVARQLAEWGERRDEESRPRMARLERDLERVLEDLADAFPLLQSLVDRRIGGQKRLPMPGRGPERVAAPLFEAVAGNHDSTEQQEHGAPPIAEGQGEPSTAPPSPESAPVDREPAGDAEPLAPPQDASHLHAAAAAPADTVAGRRRPARYGLLVQFESRPGDQELGRLVDNVISINDAHPAFARALASRSIGYHTAVAVALALAPLTVEPEREHAFVTQFLAQWGTTQSRTTGRSARQRRARA